MTFGEKIKEARKAMKMTQKQLGAKVGVKFNTVSDWENDKTKPDIDTVEKLCGVLKLVPSYIMGSKSEEEYSDIITKTIHDTDTLELIELYDALSYDDKKAIRQIISSLSKVGRG